VTWVFLFVAALLVGLALATVTGLLHDVTALIRHNPMVSPRHNAARTLPTRVLRCLAAWLGVAGAVGLVHQALRPFNHRAPLYTSAIAGTVAALLLLIVLGEREHRRRTVSEVASKRRSRATVIRPIPAGGYGQIRLDRAGIIMAAQAEDGRPIPVGTTVEVLDTERSVVRVRPVQE
jgi:membrane protein implicated in regulation of membrane protease activity